MIPKLFPGPRAAIVFIAAIFLSGCASPSPHFYTLSPIQNEVPYKSASLSHRLVIGIGPVKMAEYLEQSKIVTRPGDNQVNKAEFDRWAGSLKNDFINILAENIGSLLPSAQILLYPFRVPEPVDYQVMLEVTRFDGQLGGSVSLDSRWTIIEGQESKLVQARRSSIVEPVTGSTYGDLVAAQSRALGRLSQEISRAIKNAGRRCPESSS
jgi:uncharacterized protein